MMGSFADGDTDLSTQNDFVGGLSAVFDAVDWSRNHEEITCGVCSICVTITLQIKLNLLVWVLNKDLLKL